MAIKGYSSVEDVQGFTGLDFNSTQEAQVLRLIEAAEAFWDTATARSNWGDATQVVDEHYEASGSRLFLRAKPVVTLDGMKAGYHLQPDLVNLTAGVDYELLSAQDGIIFLGDNVWTTIPGYDYVLVTYTPTGSLPADFRLGVTMLVAHWLSTHFDPARLSYSLYSLGDGDLAARPIQGIPKDVIEILNIYRSGGIVFA